MEGIPRRCLARTWFLGGFRSVPSAESGAGGVRGGCGGNGSGGGRGVGGGASELDTESHPIGELLCGRERRPRLTTGRRGRREGGGREGGCGGDSDGSGGGGGGGPAGRVDPSTGDSVQKFPPINHHRLTAG